MHSCFPLDDSHSAVACAASHEPVAIEGAQSVRSRPLRMQCADCHAERTDPLRWRIGRHWLNLLGLWACLPVLSTLVAGDIPRAPQEPSPASASAKSRRDPPDGSNTDEAWTKEMPLLCGSLTAANLFGDGRPFGARLGFMPELDDDFESFADFQVAAGYRWELDESGRFALLRGGFEPTSHHGSADRDLFVADLRGAMAADLDPHGTTWVDLCGAGDEGESALEGTQALLVQTRRFDEGGGGYVTDRHQALPRIDRDGEFTLPATLEEIEDDHLDELAASANHDTDGHLRLHGEAGAWYDEDETGGSADAGLEFPELLIHDLRTDYTAIGSRGQFTTLYGGQVTCSLPADDGRWVLSYEYASHRLHGISSNLDDLVQQRVWLGRSFHWGGGWSFSLDAQATWWDTDVSWAAGWFLQKTF